MLSDFAASLFANEVPPDWRLLSAGAALVDSAYGVGDPGDSAGAIEVIGMKDLRNGYVTFTELGRIAGSLEDYEAYKLEVGDILLNRTNSVDLVGKVGIVAQPTDAIFASYLVRLRVDKNTVDPFFLAQWLNSDIAQRALKRIATRAVSQANINPTEFKKQCPVPLPPLPEQRKIADILRTWDEAIEACERLITAKRTRIKALSRQFFEPCHPASRTRPSNWGRFELGDVFTERDEPGCDDDRLLSITMSGGVIDRDDVGRKDVSNDDKSAYKLILPGDIGYNTMRMWQGVSGLSQLRGIVSPAYTIVTPDNRHIDARYAAHLFKSRRMVFDFERYSQGLTSDTWNLKFPAFAKIVVYLPPTEVQRQQAALMDALHEEVAALEKKREALAKQKRGLMQKLLTGEWRVKVDVGAVDA